MGAPRIEYAILPAGDGPGQDRCFTADGLVVVLDGASASDPSVSPDTGDYVDALGPLMIELIIGTPGIDLRDGLAEAIRQTADKLQLVPGKGPSSTTSIVRWGDEVVDVLVLGDSPVVVQVTDGSRETIVQHPMDHIAPELRRQYRERLAEGHGYDDEHRAILADIRRQEAPRRNLAGGYFIAAECPAASSHAASASARVADVAWCLVATDGITHHLDRVDLHRVSRCRAGALARLLARAAAWEENDDANGIKAPRSKRRDDKTIAIMSSPRARVATGGNDDDVGHRR